MRYSPASPSWKRSLGHRRRRRTTRRCRPRVDRSRMPQLRRAKRKAARSAPALRARSAPTPMRRAISMRRDVPVARHFPRLISRTRSPTITSSCHRSDPSRRASICTRASARAARPVPVLQEACHCKAAHRHDARISVRPLHRRAGDGSARLPDGQLLQNDRSPRRPVRLESLIRLKRPREAR